ncbi:MAG: alpha/beta hydrolase [Deltaproteobacteria bacterium]|nr:alpha/beta hydrolase [Deltaproteobacteria bacterium]
MKRARSCSILLAAMLLAALAAPRGVHAVPFEDALIYFPSRYPDGMWDLAGRRFPAGPWATSASDQWITTADGVKIHAWYARPESRQTGGATPAPDNPLTILYFHGNAGSIADRHGIMLSFVELGAAVLAVDYRGYGRSEGKPGEKGLYLDAEAAWNHLTGPLGVPAERIILFGKSLGGGPAVELATRVRPAGLFLQSTFTSIPDMARELLPFVPRFLIRTKMDSLAKIRNVRCPVLIIHGRRDEIVPFRMGQKLYESAPEPKRFVEIAHARHNDTVFSGPHYIRAVREFLGQVDSSQAPVAVD